MTKREMIDEITHLNASASPAFLAGFGDCDLDAYLQRLQRICARLAGPPADAAGTPEPIIRIHAGNPFVQQQLQPALL